MSVPITANGVHRPEAQGESSAHRVVRNSTLNLTAQALYAAFHLVGLILLTRFLGKERLGEYFWLFALILVVQLVVEAGISTLLTYRIAQAPARCQEIAAEATALCVVVSLVSLLAFLVMGLAWAAVRSEPAAVLSFAAAGVACAAIQVQRFAAGVFRAFESFRSENLGKILQGTAFTVLVVALVLAIRSRPGLLEQLRPVPTVVALLAASHVITALYLVTAVQRRWHCIGWRLGFGVVRDWLGKAVPLGFGDVVRGMTWQLDTVLLGWLVPPALVGIYSVAYRPLGPLNWLPRAVSTALFPALARHAVADRAALGRAFAGSIRVLWILSLPLAIGICYCAEPVIRIVAGSQYLEAALPMRILIWIACLSFISYPLGFVLMAVGKPQAYAWLVVAVFALEAMVELVLIPRWNYFGACAGSIAGELVFTAFGLALCRRLGITGIEWGRLARAGLAGAAMAGALWFARRLGDVSLVLATGLATVLFFLLCIAFGALPGNEVRHLVESLAGIFRPAAGRFRPREEAVVG